jgi:hypothetical protein
MNKPISRDRFCGLVPCDRSTLDRYLASPSSIKPSTRQRIETAIVTLGLSRAQLLPGQQPAHFRRTPDRERSMSGAMQND